MMRRRRFWEATRPNFSDSNEHLQDSSWTTSVSKAEHLDITDKTGKSNRESLGIGLAAKRQKRGSHAAFTSERDTTEQLLRLM
jgi:hypothetical protein